MSVTCRLSTKLQPSDVEKARSVAAFGSTFGGRAIIASVAHGPASSRHPSGGHDFARIHSPEEFDRNRT